MSPCLQLGGILMVLQKAVMDLNHHLPTARPPRAVIQSQRSSTLRRCDHSVEGVQLLSAFIVDGLAVLYEGAASSVLLI